MAPPRTRQSFTCHCGVVFEKTPSQIRSTTVTCSKYCAAQLRRGADNPFYGQSHSEETRARISARLQGHGLGNQHAKGYHHTPEAREKIRVATKHLWQQRFENPASNGCLPMYPDHEPFVRPSRNTEWTRTQQKNWRKDCCAWCGSTENLHLDHIIPRFMGGERTKANAQTLCRLCNLWKHWHIDWPQWKSLHTP